MDVRSVSTSTLFVRGKYGTMVFYVVENTSRNMSGKLYSLNSLLEVFLCLVIVYQRGKLIRNVKS